MVRFREHKREDIPLRVRWLNNKSANRFAVDDPEHLTTTEEQERWFDAYETSGTKKFFTICDEQKPIGFMGISQINLLAGSANLFIMIGEDTYRGKGIGKVALNYLNNFAFTELGLKQIELEVKKENINAIKTFQSVGFKYSGENDKELFMVLKEGLLKKIT